MRYWQCQECGTNIERTRFSEPEICTNPHCDCTRFNLKEEKIKCEICGNDNSKVIVVHHIVPKAFQGDNSDDNMMSVCANCHKEIHADMKEKVKEWTLAKAKYREQPPIPITKEMITSPTISPVLSTKQKLMNAIHSLEKEQGKPVSKKEVLAVFNEMGLSDEEGEVWLRRLFLEGKIVNSRPDFIETIDF
jgi:hypothetical protein